MPTRVWSLSSSCGSNPAGYRQHYARHSPAGNGRRSSLQATQHPARTPPWSVHVEHLLLPTPYHMPPGRMPDRFQRIDTITYALPDFSPRSSPSIQSLLQRPNPLGSLKPRSPRTFLHRRTPKNSHRYGPAQSRHHATRTRTHTVLRYHTPPLARGPGVRRRSQIHRGPRCWDHHHRHSIGALPSLGRGPSRR
ncbi:hypothetical protein GY45DRAFT_433923 [Cubamyces sp. BRFM 1775]|nr:hypothetical protein GY45DRAFT_433923 [Cubamyces sp. BRFM 1775]